MGFEEVESSAISPVEGVSWRNQTWAGASCGGKMQFGEVRIGVGYGLQLIGVPTGSTTKFQAHLQGFKICSHRALQYEYIQYTYRYIPGNPNNQKLVGRRT